DLVVDALRLGRRAAVEPLAGHARAPRRRAAALPGRPPAAHARDLRHRRLLARRDARLGPGLLRHAAPPRPPVALPPGGRRSLAIARADGAADGVELHPLPARERALEPARVPGLGRDGPALPAHAPPRLGGAGLVAPRAAVGDRRDPPLGARRRRVVPARDVRGGGRGLPRARGRLPPDLRAGRPRPRDARAHLMGSSLRVFLVGGLISYRALFNWIRPYVYVPTMLGAPLFQIVFFTYLGRYSQAGRGDAFFVVGNAVQVCGMSCVYGMTMAVANERWFGT